MKQTLLKRYPPRLHEDTIEDVESVQQHISAMAAEMSKKRPHDHVVLPLQKSTYSTRRDYITSDDLADVKEEYPALQFPTAVSLLTVQVVPHILIDCCLISPRK